VIEPLRDRIVGRVSLENIKDPFGGQIIVHVNEEITEEKANEVQAAGIEKVRIRSVLTCESQRGVFQVLAQRAALQDQRVRDATQRAHEIQAKLAETADAVASATDLMTRLEDQLKDERDAARRKQIAEQQAEIRLRLEDRRRAEQDLRARAVDADQLARGEQVKWEELNSKLDDLDRELGAAGLIRMK
jgi:hypothetical protein